MQDDTIVAIATGPVPAAIGILRISGSESLPIVQRCLKGNKDLPDRQMLYRNLYAPEGGEILDQVMMCYFAEPRSYTGEEMVEIFAHGGMLNMTRILEALQRAGARLAEPGEFTQRAFLNQKLDLTQAEAVMDLIHAQSTRALDEAQKQLSGSVSQSVALLRDKLLHLIVRIESSIDFSEEEELAPLPVEAINEEGRFVIDHIERMLRASQRVRLQGYRIAFLGKPNAGKSSLFNLILGHERAIVTDISGTTTDTIEESTQLGPYKITLIDTAGLTESMNPIEQLGIQRSILEAQKADIMLWIHDANEPFELPDEELREGFLQDAQDHKLLVIFNKIDLLQSLEDTAQARDALLKTLPSLKPEMLFELSTLTRQGIAGLEEAIRQNLSQREELSESVTLITSQRHIHLLEHANACLLRALRALGEEMPAECIAADIHQAADSLAQITGSIASDEVLNTIFSTFCIGK